MKKRITSLLLAAMLLLTLVAFVGCGETGTQYTCVDVDVLSDDSAYANVEDLIKGTVLVINEDGTWKLSKPIIAFIKIDVFSGTYTEKNGIYAFEGFDFDLAARGVETDGGFEMYFVEELTLSNILSDELIVLTVEFEKAN